MCMLRDRFQAILSNFHVADNQANPPYPDPQHQPLAKLQPFIDMCNTQFKAAFDPGQNISIDEGCCPWRGHLQFKQFNPRKPNKYYINFFQVSDPNIGYLTHFKVYTGAGSCQQDGISSDDGQNNNNNKNSPHALSRCLCSQQGDIVFTWIPTLHLCHWHKNSSVGTHCAVVQHNTALVSH